VLPGRGGPGEGKVLEKQRKNREKKQIRQQNKKKKGTRNPPRAVFSRGS
jgi:hypothetical protein